MKRLRILLADFATGFWASDTAVMVATAVLVGLGGGLGAIAFRWSLATAQQGFDLIALWFSFLGRFHIVLLPALGGLVVGLLVHFLAPEATGPGVSSVIEAIALREGRIRPIVIAVKPVVTAITLGSRGSGGRAGPIVQIGSAIGSSLSQVLRLSGRRTKNLTACGAAAGLAAMFNTPLAGAMFALEILLVEFSLLQFGSVIVASVIGGVVGRVYWGNAPTLACPPSAFPRTWELLAFALLGCAAAFVGVAFTRLLHGVDDLFSSLQVPPYLRPAAGGLLVGLAGVWFPQVLGVGYDSVEAVLFNRLALAAVISLGLLKLVATSVTIGSGGAGGIFGPCLYIGAMLGALFHHLVSRTIPALPATTSYTLVGMSAVLAAASQAPITAMLALFEMTRDYSAILPLMLGTIISAIVARRLYADSIYTVKLGRRGLDVFACRNFNPMGTILVREAMTPIEAMPTVAPDTPLTTLATIFAETHHHGLAVLDGNRRLLGVVTLSDLEEAQTEQLANGSVCDIYTTNVRTAFPDETLQDALCHFGAMDVGRIPVVDRNGANHVVGMLRRGDIVRSYSRACIDDYARMDSVNRARLRQQAGVHLCQFTLLNGHLAVGRTLQELSLPDECLIASIRRGGCVIVPHGDTRLEAGDEIVALMSQDREDALRCYLGAPDMASRSPLRQPGRATENRENRSRRTLL